MAWVRRFVLFHECRHPSELGAREVEEFLDALTARSVSASTHQQALCALVFLYERALRLPSPWVEHLARPQRSERLPVVLTRQEAREVLGRMRGVPKLMAALLYGAGLRLLECARLRVKDIDFAANHVVIHDAKGRRDRLTVLPGSLRVALRDHLASVSDLHCADLALGAGHVAMPHALSRKYPNANRTWPWQWVFPATRRYRDPASGELRRHHLHETVFQRAFHEAVKAAHLTKPATCHSLRQQLRDPSPRGRLRHPHDSRAPRPPRRGDHHDLHPRLESRPVCGAKPPRLRRPPDAWTYRYQLATQAPACAALRPLSRNIGQANRRRASKNRKNGER